VNHAQQVASLRALGILPPEDEAEREPDEPREIDFDGGARTPPPTPENPESDHNEVVSELLASRQVVRGPSGWEVNE
jgi:hypothetical protein